jgi:hypothetical protein
MLGARVQHLLATTPRSGLLAPMVFGGDTTVAVSSLSWPWHRVSVTTGGQLVMAQIATTAVERSPWCAAVVAGDITGGEPPAVAADPEFLCEHAVLTLSADSLTVATAALVDALVVPPVPDTIAAWPYPAPERVWIARDVVHVPAGVSVEGLLIAPIVWIAAGARVRGAILASDRAVIEPGALVHGDRLVLSRVLAASARLTLLGRRGMLSPY